MKTSAYILLISLITFNACNPQRQIAGNYSYETECYSSESDGSETVKAWGNGRNRKDAVEQAQKNAVSDVIFKGIIRGKNDCRKSPLVSEPNAREKHEDYFNAFFADDGPFSEFVELEDERLFDKISRDRKGAVESVTHGVVLRIKTPALKQQLIKDGIIK